MHLIAAVEMYSNSSNSTPFPQKKDYVKQSCGRRSSNKQEVGTIGTLLALLKDRMSVNHARTKGIVMNQCQWKQCYEMNDSALYYGREIIRLVYVSIKVGVCIRGGN